MIHSDIILSVIKFTGDSKSNEGVCIYNYNEYNIYICVCVIYGTRVISMWPSIQKVTKHYQIVILNNSLPFDKEAQIFGIQEA